MTNGQSWENKVVAEGFGEQMLGGMPFSQPSCFFNGHMVRKYGLRVREDLHFGMDYYFFLQLFCLSDFNYYPRLIAEYLFHPASKSSSQNSKFADDWSRVYASFLKSNAPSSYGDKKIFSTQMLEANLDFPKVEDFSEEIVERSYFHYLYNQMKFRYEDLDLTMTREILAEIERVFLVEYEKRQLGKIAWRSRFPSSIIKTFRKKHSSS